MSKEDNLSPLKTAEDTKDTKTPVTERTSSFTLIKLQKKRQVLSNNSTDDTKVDGNFKQRRKAQTPPDNSSITRSGSVPLTTKTPGRKIISENKNKQSLSPPASKSLGKQKNPTAQKTPGKKKIQRDHPSQKVVAQNIQLKQLNRKVDQNPNRQMRVLVRANLEVLNHLIALQQFAHLNYLSPLKLGLL